MRFVSTRGGDRGVNLSQALFAGTAPDGGLWVPAELKRLAPDRLEELIEGRSPASAESCHHAARILAEHFFGDELDAQTIARLVSDALSFPMPLRQLADNRWMLELFHGPTLAFKDVAARTMARLMAVLLERGDAPRRLQEADDPLTVLVATSGDTGAAVAHAFFGLERFEVVVLFPRGQVSEAQRRLFSTLGGNVRVAAIEGSFDDCQHLAKEAFVDDGLNRRRRLLSANSINIGRLLPQTFYYAHLARELGRAPRPLVVCVPSGNFGNLTAGLIARAVGVPIDRFVAATNINDVVPEYLRSGRFEPRASMSTISNAMDVDNPSNMERVRWLFPAIEELRGVVSGLAFDDDQTLAAMVDVARRSGFVLDPHTAVGHLGLERELEGADSATGVVVATAHPAKFLEVLRRAGLDVSLPPEIATRLERPEQIEPLPATISAFREWL